MTVDHGGQGTRQLLFVDGDHLRAGPMSRCALLAGTDRVRATFTVYLVGDVYAVAVAGDFNAWDATADPFVRAGDAWSATMMMDSGRRYAFRYLPEDGTWSTTTKPTPTRPTARAGTARSWISR